MTQQYCYSPGNNRKLFLCELMRARGAFCKLLKVIILKNKYAGMKLNLLLACDVAGF